MAISNFSSKEFDGKNHLYRFWIPGGNYMEVACRNSPFNKGDVLRILEINDSGLVVETVPDKPNSDLPILCFLITRIPLGDDTDFVLCPNDDFQPLVYWKVPFRKVSSHQKSSYKPFGGNVSYTVLGLLYRTTIVLAIDRNTSEKFEWSVQRIDDVV